MEKVETVLQDRDGPGWGIRAAVFTPTAGGRNVTRSTNHEPRRKGKGPPRKIGLGATACGILGGRPLRQRRMGLLDMKARWNDGTVVRPRGGQAPSKDGLVPRSPHAQPTRSP